MPRAALHIHQARDLFGRGAFHGFVVAQMPDGRAYLLDATVRQLFDTPCKAARPASSRELVDWEVGLRMRSTPGGEAIAHELIEKGFVELTDEVASTYGYGLSGKAGFAAAHFLRVAPISYTKGEFLEQLPYDEAWLHERAEERRAVAADGRSR